MSSRRFGLPKSSTRSRSTTVFEVPTVLTVGDVLAGKYRIEKVLGVGGMGMVLAAMHLELEQRVAIKVMLPEATRSPDHVERFRREAKAAGKLRNEHICRVLDVSKLDDGGSFIVMELLEGQDLSDLLAARGPLTVPDAVDYVLQAIEGIAEAHATAIVHRDLKPQNLFVTTSSDGSPLVKVLDFGISKSSVAGGATKTGEMMGSPSYMAPEQMMSAKDVDGRADVWALGVILYEAVTGRLPFENDMLPALCMSVMRDQPLSPSARRADLPPAFSELIMRCLEKPLEQRMPHVGALAAALVPFGRASAAAAAERINKTLSRAHSAIVPPADGALASTPAAAMITKPAGLISTLQASAGSMEAYPRAPRTVRVGLIIGSTTLVVVAVFASAFVFTRGRRDDTRPAAASKSASPLSATTNAAVAPASEPAPPATTMSAPDATSIPHQPAPPAASAVTGSRAKSAHSSPARAKTPRVTTSPNAGSGSASAPATPAVPYDPLSRRTRGNE